MQLYGFNIVVINNMKKIEEQMCRAVREHRNWSKGNTRVTITDNGNGVSVYLYDNCIYSKVFNHASFTLAGWNTATTRSRLKALGINVYQRDYTPIYDGRTIDSLEWYYLE